MKLLDVSWWFSSYWYRFLLDCSGESRKTRLGLLWRCMNSVNGFRMSVAWWSLQFGWRLVFCIAGCNDSHLSIIHNCFGRKNIKNFRPFWVCTGNWHGYCCNLNRTLKTNRHGNYRKLSKMWLWSCNGFLRERSFIQYDSKNSKETGTGLAALQKTQTIFLV